MNYNNLLVEIKDEITLLTINRPQALNALNLETIMELRTFFELEDMRKETKVVVITGAGEKAFVAGADIKEMQDMTPARAERLSQLGQEAFTAIQYCSKPVIAAVNGVAFGGGCELALACDLIYASKKARFGQPEVVLGLLPGWGGTQRLSMRVGLGKAKEIILTGDHYTAEEAYRMGLVDRLFEPAELMEGAFKVAGTIAQRAPLAVALSKELINSSLETEMEEGLDLESEAFSIVGGSADMEEGVAAFLEKRAPRFKGV